MRSFFPDITGNRIRFPPNIPLDEEVDRVQAECPECGRKWFYEPATGNWVKVGHLPTFPLVDYLETLPIVDDLDDEFYALWSVCKHADRNPFLFVSERYQRVYCPHCFNDNSSLVFEIEETES